MRPQSAVFTLRHTGHSSGMLTPKPNLESSGTLLGVVDKTLYRDLRVAAKLYFAWLNDPFMLQVLSSAGITSGIALMVLPNCVPSPLMSLPGDPLVQYSTLKPDLIGAKRQGMGRVERTYVHVLADKCMLCCGGDSVTMRRWSLMYMASEARRSNRVIEPFSGSFGEYQC